jgi:hypothetical protein
MKALPTEAPHVGHMLNVHMRRHRYYQAALARDIGNPLAGNGAVDARGRTRCNWATIVQ